MIVKYIKERGFEGDGKDPLLTINREYIVLRVLFRIDNRPTTVVILDDREKGPCSFDLSCFEIIDTKIPSDWRMGRFSSGVGFEIQPEEFFGDFWDVYFNEEDEATEKILQDVVQKINSFHNFK